MVVVKTYIILYNSHISHTIQVATTLLEASKPKRAGRGIYLEIFSWLQLYHSMEYSVVKSLREIHSERYFWSYYHLVPNSLHGYIEQTILKSSNAQTVKLF